MKRIIFSGMQVLQEKKWTENYAVVVEDQLIKAIIPTDMIKHHLPATQYEFSAQHYLAPGLIDMHIHGIQGHDVMDGTPEALLAISKVLAKEGVTGFLATTMSASVEILETVLQAAKNAMSESEGTALLGVHLEGPFIALASKGAQCADAFSLPDIAVMQRLQKAAEGTIKLVTLAPELAGALDLIAYLHKSQVIASIGHTKATYAETAAAIKAGCSHATHLFNAMGSLQQREPGALGALLLSDEVTAELIVDGVHLHPAIVELALCLKGKDRLVLITDAMRATCLGDGQYDLGGLTVNVQAGCARLPDGTLAGSTLRMPQALRNMMQFSHCQLADAITMAAETPARILGLGERKGSIVVGKDADLIIMTDALDVVLTLRQGVVVFEASSNQ